KYILFIIGLSLLIGAVYIYLNEKAFSERAIIVEGTVIGSSVSISNDKVYYHPVITFKTNEEKNIKFVASASGYSPLYSVGESIEIIYDPTHPEEAIIKKYFSAFGTPILMSFFGTLFFIILFIFHFSQKKAKYIYEKGTRIITVFDSVKQSYNLKGKKFFQIYTTCLDTKTNQKKVYKSEKLFFDPTDFIKSKNITVILHPENPTKYLMDISFLA
ncbi:DUF3592 domain-containing protein, partial [Flavobacterium sp. HTF]|uniref:DUF3592 domain-containing protein n=1 Tax=Flavobacterium sp. HTF TaxID=2170732 RepID=UPI000D5F18B3